MGKLVAKYPLAALMLIWTALIGAASLLPSEPRPQAIAAKPAWAGTLPPGMAAVHRLIITRYRPIGG